MLFYRFRPWSDLSLKELYYSEIYFASNDECNDPLDGKTYHVFPNDIKLWKRFIDLCTSKGPYILDSSHVNQIANYFNSKCPATFDEIFEQTQLHAFAELACLIDSHILRTVIADIERNLKIYEPSSDYFASFSESCNEPLMWSHYSSKHDGFCLIFRFESNLLLQHPKMVKKCFESDSGNGIAQRMSWGINESFTLEKMKYDSESKEQNAFFCLPKIIFEDSLTAAQEQNYCDELSLQKITKNDSWAYEKEYRAILNSPSSFMFGDKFELSKQNRLFHFHPDQLIGIIYGSRMTNENKTRIKEIIIEKEKNNEFGEFNRLISSFMLFDSHLSHKSKEVEICPIEVFNAGKWYDKNNDKFDSMYSEWKDGFVIEFDQKTGKGRRRKIAT